MRFVNPTAEEIDIQEAHDVFLEALQFQVFVLKTAAIAYIVGLPLFVFGSGQVGYFGMVATVIGLFCLLYHAILGIGVEKKRRAVAELLKPYMRRKALPLLEDLRAKFADDPNINFIMNDDGMITVVRKDENGA